MAETGELGHTDGFISDYTFAHPYIFVAGAAQRHAQLATDATTTSILGIAITEPDSGQQGTYQWTGKTKVYAGGALTIFDIITTNGSGRATACTSGDVPLAQLLQTAGADGDIVSIKLLNIGARWPGVV